MQTTVTPLKRIERELRLAMAATKCHRCGCFQDCIDTLHASVSINEAMKDLLSEARSLGQPKRYDCLGCETCWPAVVQNIAAEVDPAIAEGSHCATAEPETRDGWPPLPGDYQVLRFHAPVAVCVLNSDHLVSTLAEAPLDGLSIVGSLHTENLGIEHLIRNTLANPHIRFLIVCGEDTRKAIGHLPGQSLLALMEHGIDDNSRIIGAKGKRPLLKNLHPDHISAFREQVRVIDKTGTTDVIELQSLIAATALDDPGPYPMRIVNSTPVPIEKAGKPGRLVLDPAGYFIVYPDRGQQRLLLEHYSNQGLLDRMLSAEKATDLYLSAIDAGLVSRLDHAAYLGRELARAEQALKTGDAYVQDRAPGVSSPPSKIGAGEVAGGCGCSTGEEGRCA